MAGRADVTWGPNTINVTASGCPFEAYWPLKPNRLALDRLCRGTITKWLSQEPENSLIPPAKHQFRSGCPTSVRSAPPARRQP